MTSAVLRGRAEGIWGKQRNAKSFTRRKGGSPLPLQDSFLCVALAVLEFVHYYHSACSVFFLKKYGDYFILLLESCVTLAGPTISSENYLEFLLLHPHLPSAGITSMHHYAQCPVRAVNQTHGSLCAWQQSTELHPLAANISWE